MKRYAILFVAAVGLFALAATATASAQEDCASCAVPRFRFGSMAGAAHGLGCEDGCCGGGCQGGCRGGCLLGGRMLGGGGAAAGMMGGLGHAVHNFLNMAEHRGELCRKLKEPEQPRGPVTGTYAYPYYTTRGPRDFLLANPPTIGPY